MGNQPSRKNIPGKGGKPRFSRKMVNNTKKSVSKKRYNEAAKIALGAGLKNSGKGFLAAAVLASAKAYNISQTKKGRVDYQKITNSAITRVINSRKFDVTKQGRNLLKSGINTAISQRRKK